MVKDVKVKEGKEPEVQKIFIAITFQKGGGEKCQQAHMEVDYKPSMPMLNPHKRDYGVSGLQASAASLPSNIEHLLEQKGYVVTHPGKDNPKL